MEGRIADPNGNACSGGACGHNSLRPQPQKSTPIIVPEGAQAEPNVWNAGELDKTCLRWFDGCVACIRDMGCSNIRIVCVPREEVECLERREADKKKVRATIQPTSFQACRFPPVTNPSTIHPSNRRMP
jgi:hypothetical protein